jgi:hypothetical protein
MKKLALILPLIAVLTACGPNVPTANQIERRKQEELSKQGVETVGFPAITNFAEKRMMKDIIELRDKMQPTYTYIMDMNGRPHKVCDSLGYGLPYATQYTNPQARQAGNLSDGTRTSDVLAQADPNGLYSPASADGTWILCLNPKTKKAEPQYIEPRVLIMTYPME